MGKGRAGSSRFSVFSGEPVTGLLDLMSMPTLPEGLQDSVDVRALAFGAVAEPIFAHEGADGFSLVNVRLAPDAILLNHSHDMDCLYYVLSGAILLGRRRLGPGAGFFVPASAPYGYRAGPDGAAVLEFRHGTSFGMAITETSPARWQELADVAKEHDHWPGFAESVALHPADQLG